MIASCITKVLFKTFNYSMQSGCGKSNFKLKKKKHLIKEYVTDRNSVYSHVHKIKMEQETNKFNFRRYQWSFLNRQKCSNLDDAVILTQS